MWKCQTYMGNYSEQCRLFFFPRLWVHSYEKQECQTPPTDMVITFKLVHFEIMTSFVCLILSNNYCLSTSATLVRVRALTCMCVCVWMHVCRACTCTVHHMRLHPGEGAAESHWCSACFQKTPQLMGHKNAPAFGPFRGLAFHIVCRLLDATYDLFSLCLLRLRQRERNLL